MNNPDIVGKYSPEQAKYLRELEVASKLVEAALKIAPECDVHDLYHIAQRLSMTPSERLALGLRRKCVAYAS